MTKRPSSIASGSVLRRAATMALNEVSLWLRRRPAYHREFASKEQSLRASGPPVAPSERRWWNRRGFLSDKAIYYSKGEIDLYISDLQRMILCSRISYANSAVVFNKLVFSRLMDRVGCGVPVLASIKRGRLTSESSDSPIQSAESLKSLMEQGSRYVLKPIAGMEGREVTSLAKTDRPGVLNCGGADVPATNFLNWIAGVDGFLIQPAIAPSGYSQEVWPQSLNTMRVITMISPSSGDPFVAAVSHKFGTRRSRVVDNWKQGGVLAPVDVATGELGFALLYPDSGRLQPIEHHPDSGCRIQGRIIPRWSAFVGAMLDLAREFDFLPLLGWDVAWSGDELVVVEANFNPDWSIVQCFKPLLADDRVRDFFQHHRVI